MVGRTQGKQQVDSEDLRKAAMHNAFWKRQKDSLLNVTDSVSEPCDMSRSAVVLPPLKPKTAVVRRYSTDGSLVSSSPVYSMRNLRRRTTASVDFPLHTPRQPSRERRLCSPTRKNNPQPDGLVYQSPYNRHNKACEIWNPNQDIIESRLPGMMLHLRDVNFSCKHSEQPVPTQRSAPEVEYSMQSSYRQTFQMPEVNAYGQPQPRPTRFGNKPYSLPSKGIVPNSVASGTGRRPTSARLIWRQRQ